MRNISLVLLAFMLTLTFTASDIIVEKGNKPGNTAKCPNLEQLQESGAHSECPYLSGNEGSSTCPYMKENSKAESGGCPYMEGQTSECPYLNGNANECPYLKEHGQEVIKVIKAHPLPEGKNT